MILIIGLGNPGKKFRNTRHNVGFLVLDQLKRGKNFSRWKQSKKFQAKISQGKIGRQKIILAKPQTFMNSSGKSVKILTAYYKLQTINLIVVHDDLDISLGQIKISKKKGAAGHKGAQSIIDELKTKDFIRFRIGIKNQESEIKNVKRFVLKKFTKKEKQILQKIKKRACQALKTAIEQGVEAVMTKYNE